MAIQEDVALIPKSTLFGNPVRTNPQISPDSTRIAYLAPGTYGQSLALWVRSYDQDHIWQVTPDKGQEIRSYFWTSDSQNILFLQDKHGTEDFHLYIVDLLTQDIHDLTPFEKIQAQLLAQHKDWPDEVVIGLNKENPALHDAYRLHLTSGMLKLVANNPGNVMHWVTDTRLQVRGAVAVNPDGGTTLLVRADEQSTWQPMVSWNADDSLSSGPLAFSHNRNILYLKDGRNSNTARLVALDLDKGSGMTIAEDLTYDVDTVLLHPETGEIQAVAFQKERYTWQALDPDIQKDFNYLSSIQAGDIYIQSRDETDTRWIVRFIVDNGPIAFYLFDRSRQAAEFLFYNRPDLQAYTLAQTTSISFKARDGLLLRGYLTLPQRHQQGPLPLVLNVHGGPWERQTWGYDAEAQWFANRGYACLEINYRGSRGYGKAFLNAGDKEWGRKMHDDLIDSIAWAIQQGVADPDKVAIYGGSYGGYAALVGATFTPDTFCCAISQAGPCNLISLIKTFPPYWSAFLSVFYKRVGHPDLEAELLRSRSPLFHVDQIKIPILIAQGANDPRVKLSEAEQIVAALKARGIAHEYILFSDEGHNFLKPENQQRFYNAAEQFLAQYLGGRSEVITSQEKSSAEMKTT